jgi:hypothetical protein
MVRRWLASLRERRKNRRRTHVDAAAIREARRQAEQTLDSYSQHDQRTGGF